MGRRFTTRWPKRIPVSPFWPGRSGNALAIEPPALAIIKAYSWPGNIRQLENIIKRLVVLNRSIILVAPARDAQRRKECPRSAGSTPRSIGSALVHNTAATRAGCGAPSLARLAQLGPSVGPLGSSKHRHDDLLDENHK
ncbi:MAG: AAA-type ATPase lid domain-containing protein [Acidithiobacillus sp.]